MADAEAELFKLGVPVKTRHNEVAPSQYEIAPIFEDSQPRHRPPDADDGGAAQDRRRSTAWPACCTRSRSPASTARASTTTGRCRPTPARTCSNPGDTPHDNAQFLVFCVAVIRAVAKYPELLRVVGRRRANDHRLGRQRGPAGDHLDLPGRPAPGRHRPAREGRRQEHQAGRRSWRSACRVLPKLPQRRRRPQPHQPVRLHRQQVRVPRRRRLARSIAGPNTVLNTIVAESLDYIATQLEKADRRAARTSTQAIQDLLPGIIKESKKVLFNGDNYTEEWHKEAEKRGLPNLRNTVDVLPVIVRKDIDRAVHEVQGLQRSASCRAASTSCARATSRRSTIEGQLTPHDGPDDDPAGGAALPGRGRRRPSTPPRPRASTTRRRRSCSRR